MADRSGERVWFLQRIKRGTTLVDLITIDDNTVVGTVESDRTYFIGGLLEDDLVVVASGEGEKSTLSVSPRGAITEVSSCLDYSTKYGALILRVMFGNHSACTSLDGRHLVFFDVMTGQLDAIPAFGSGTWGPTHLPEIPSANTRGVDQLLLRLRVPDASTAPYDITQAVYVADLSKHSVRLVYEHERPGSVTPLGIVDGLLIAGVKIEGRSSITLVDIESGEWQTLVDLPPGYFIYDAQPTANKPAA